MQPRSVFTRDGSVPLQPQPQRDATRRDDGVTHGCVRMMNMLDTASRRLDAAAAAVRAPEHTH